MQGDLPKVGWVRFRWSRAVPGGAKSYRVARDRAGRWHVAFAAVPQPIPAPGRGEVVGVDRGVAVSAALSTGELLNVRGLRDTEKARLGRLLRKLARARRGSNRRAKVKTAVARLKAREADRRKAPGRVRKVNPRHTSQTCNACKHVASESRESQALFLCVACGHQDNADVNAAKNMRDAAAGHAVAARGGLPLGGPVNREPRPDLPSAA
ncbi:transposase [Nonomuraea wenchangensis]